MSFFAPELVFTEAAQHLPLIAEKRGTDPEPLLNALKRFRSIVETVDDDITAPLEQIAMARIGTRDPMAGFLAAHGTLVDRLSNGVIAASTALTSVHMHPVVGDLGRRC